MVIISRHHWLQSISKKNGVKTQSTHHQKTIPFPRVSNYTWRTHYGSGSRFWTLCSLVEVKHTSKLTSLWMQGAPGVSLGVKVQHLAFLFVLFSSWQTRAVTAVPLPQWKSVWIKPPKRKWDLIELHGAAPSLNADSCDENTGS